MQLQIITPTKNFFNETVKSLSIDGDHGRVVILPRHAPYVYAIGNGTIKIGSEGADRHAAIMGGYVEVMDNHITLIADVAEWPDEIDQKRAQSAKERAEERLKDANQDRERAMKSRRRAEVRMKLSVYQH